jgi:hypothetical protein
MRSKRSREALRGGLIGRGILFELRSRNPRRVLEQIRKLKDDEAVVGQGIVELALALSGAKGGANAVVKAEGLPLILECMNRFAASPFIQEQVCP